MFGCACPIPTLCSASLELSQASVVVERFEGLGDVGLLWVSQRCYWGGGGGNDSDCVHQVLRVRGSSRALWVRQLSHNSLRGFGKYNQSLADYKAE